ncbi:MAG: hypothetical protein ACE5GW_06930, partial [Planctomycetota bacterium]
MPPTAIANATSDTTLELRNITTNGAWTSPVTYDPNGNWLSVNAGSGDLIELKAENAVGEDTELIDFVPAGPDVALPDMDPTAITPTHTPATSTFRLDFPAGALKDNSFPLNALLYLEEDPTVSASQTVPSSGHVFALTISDSAVTEGDRAVLEVTDDYGNRAELHFVVGGGVPTAAGLSSFQGSATQTAAELSGLAGLTATGVLPYGRELVTGQGVHSMPGAVLDLAVVLSYRSGIALDGPVGQSWDWNLDARLEASGPDYGYLPGNGSSWGPFTPSGTNVWDSPKGIFSELTYDKTLGEYRLQDATGAALVFHGKSHLLIRTEDGYGNRIELIRNVTDQVVEIRDDLDRRTLLHWYRNGRLAGLEDFTSRRVLLDYDSQGRLVTWTRADGSRLTWSYEGSAARLAEVRDASGKIVIKTEYAYDAGTGRYLVSKQWTPHNLNQGAPILYGDDPGGGVLVTDALGAERVYHFATSAPNHLESLEVRSNLNLRAPGGSYPAGGGDDPISWRTRFAVDPNNWQLSARWYEVEWPAPTGIVTDIEKESWSYESPNDPDPILRGRLKDHTLEGDQTTTGDDLTESWSYTPASHPWPTLHTDFQQRQTQLEYDAHGQLLRRWQEGITMAVGQGEPPYTIETRFAYDSRGRLEKEWRP